MRIGFFDSGIGGMTVLHQALKFLPYEDYLFYADTKHVPYGEKSKEEVREYIIHAVEFIAKHHVKALVIACNTATSIVIEELRNLYSFPILGIEPAVKPAVDNMAGRQKKVLVLATNLTLKEKKYHDLVQRIDSEDIVDSLALPGLVQFAENFEFDENRVIPYLEKELSSFDIQQYGTVVLGCTHFPYFEGILRKVFPEEVDFISGSIGTAKNLKRILESKKLVNQGTGDIQYFKSGIEVQDSFSLSNYQKLFQILDGYYAGN
ncbi:glutamate racemase [Paenibacillus riograndensis]|uniref:Glutamate racemase n=1 Tax=Paenibacillus riograndensis SBR5 TaxID=1073571 RepID=A0A0E4CW99_9BACL|nr:glutamate racemase [Paenibacillus riograndensis]CQR55061.1 Glutamate racemase 2 [Paenibacillus riograndensis SBR5]